MGQAFPIYITVVAGLLLLAFAYFAVGQAAATRNGAQTAADAAALAAAQDAREQLRDGWLEVILDPERWDEFLDGAAYSTEAACRRAAAFAAKNDAEVWGEGCRRLPAGEEGFWVEVRTLNTVGESVIPGTEKQHATARAAAVLEPLCTFEVPDVPTPSESPAPAPDEDGEPPPILGLTCDGVSWTIDPDRPKLPDVTDLFTVRLAD